MTLNRAGALAAAACVFAAIHEFRATPKSVLRGTFMLTLYTLIMAATDCAGMAKIPSPSSIRE